jgi:hypothetical protein
MRPAPARQNERGRVVHPALIMGSDQLFLYAAYIARAERQLEAQVHAVFDRLPGELRLLECSRDARRAWTQLSFGRGGGGGLVRALQHVRDCDAPLDSIFTDDALTDASDSVKRARVTAGDAALIERSVLPVLAAYRASHPAHSAP